MRRLARSLQGPANLRLERTDYRVSCTLVPVASVPKVSVSFSPLNPDMHGLVPEYDQQTFTRRLFV